MIPPVDDLLFILRAVDIQDLRERGAVHEVHHDEIVVADLDSVHYTRDIRIVQRREQLDLLQKRLKLNAGIVLTCLTAQQESRLVSCARYTTLYRSPRSVVPIVDHLSDFRHYIFPPVMKSILNFMTHRDIVVQNFQNLYYSEKLYNMKLFIAIKSFHG